MDTFSEEYQLYWDINKYIQNDELARSVTLSLDFRCKFIFLRLINVKWINYDSRLKCSLGILGVVGNLMMIYQSVTPTTWTWLMVVLKNRWHATTIRTLPPKDVAGRSSTTAFWLFELLFPTLPRFKFSSTTSSVDKVLIFVLTVLHIIKKWTLSLFDTHMILVLNSRSLQPYIFLRWYLLLDSKFLQ